MYTTKRDLLQAYLQRAQAIGLQATVLMDGDVNAEVAIVGEAPGNQETKTGRAFIGGAGQILWSSLRRLGMDRTKFYITNVVKRQLVDDNNEDDKRQFINPNELSHWESLVQWELAQLPNLRTVIVLGNYALKALTGNIGIGKWRGSVLKCEIPTLDGTKHEVQVICAYNPALVLREPKTEIIFQNDLSKLPIVMSGRWVQHSVEATINPSYEEALEWLRVYQESLSPISFDIEVHNNELACIGLADNPNTGICINLLDTNGHHFTLEQEVHILAEVQKILSKPGVQLIAQNGTFDSYYLALKNRIIVPRIWFDTLLAHHTLYSQLPHNLGFLVSQYTTHPYYKDEGKDWRNHENIDEFWTYNVKDACLTWACHAKLLDELKKSRMDNFFFNHVMALQPVLINMTIMGINIDTELKEYFVNEVGEKVTTLREQFYQAVFEITGDPDYRPSPTSPKQLQELFFNKLKLVGRGTSTDEANRKCMRNHHRTSPQAKKMLTCLDEYKEEDKFFGTYAKMRVAEEDNLLRSEWKQYGTASAPGRLSSAGLDFLGIGGNAQNLPQRIQPIIIAEEGRELVYYDLAQAEARVVGWEAKIVKWQHQFEKARLEGGYDCHRALASEMWGIPYDSVPTKDKDANGKPTLRFIAKRCRHGLNYRMGADRLAETTGLSLTEAHNAYNIYHRTTPELMKWWTELEDEVRRNKMLYNALGRRLVFLERITPESLESIVAFKPQSLIGDHNCRVMYQSLADDKWPRKSRIILNIHDALVATCEHDDVEQTALVMKKYAEQPIFIRGEPLIIPADFKRSQPTKWVDNEGRLEYIVDSNGKHRWYKMITMEF